MNRHLNMPHERDDEKVIFHISEHDIDNAIKKSIKAAVNRRGPLGQCTVTKEARKAVEALLYKLPKLCELRDCADGRDALLLDQQINKVKPALEAISKDEYYPLIPAKYFSVASMRELAALCHCDRVTTWRNITRLLDLIALRMFGVLAYSEQIAEQLIQIRTDHDSASHNISASKGDRERIANLLYAFPGLCEQLKTAEGTEKKDLEKQISRIKAAVEYAKKDPHYSIILAKYFARAKIREIADMCACNPSTVWRRCNTLLDTIALNYSEVDEWEEETKN